MCTEQDRLNGGFIMGADWAVKAANPAKLCGGPYEKQRDPDTYYLSDGCTRRLPCAGSDDHEYS